MFEEQIERRLRGRADGEPPKNDFLDLLLDHRGAEDGKAFDRQTLLSLLTDLFSAGSETTSATVEWAMAELLQNPSTMAKARDELAQVIGSKPEIEESDMGELKYLQAIVKETFRLHPPAPLLLPRQAETTSEIGGYEVPKGARVLVNVWAIGRDSKVWPDPEKFLPERFLEGEIDFRGRYFELAPFGSGRRMCPGMPLAVRMVHLMLACLLHRFDWRLPADVEKNGLDMTEKFGTILSLKTPLHAVASVNRRPKIDNVVATNRSSVNKENAKYVCRCIDRVPNLELRGLVVDADDARISLYTGRGIELRSEILVREPQQQAGLPHGHVPQ
ncbi:hypothetical protein PR202_gb19229 [Eleusine coracana subsp. coracana]|uniref:Uncharacterized protein n=1 Tax=Eleusine coracana subsp. coracana TaxID=191504 RepID=A0AAV5F9B0_ELECO|nr:hypothetical protein PR202_gb19229 [Eleusine coracana subsp. coracana]